jgi:hypothetical protein
MQISTTTVLRVGVPCLKRVYALDRRIARATEEFDAEYLGSVHGNPDEAQRKGIQASWARRLNVIGEAAARIVGALIPPVDPCSVGVSQVRVRGNHVEITKFPDANWDRIEETFNEALSWASRACA